MTFLSFLSNMETSKIPRLSRTRTVESQKGVWRCGCGWVGVFACVCVCVCGWVGLHVCVCVWVGGCGVHVHTVCTCWYVAD